MSLIDEGPVRRVRMANLAIVGSHSVNGVAALHTELLKNYLFRDFHEMYPNRINSKTNGITPRRWLLKCNQDLAQLIGEKIGYDWVDRPRQAPRPGALLRRPGLSPTLAGGEAGQQKTAGQNYRRLTATSPSTRTPCSTSR